MTRSETYKLVIIPDQFVGKDFKGFGKKDAMLYLDWFLSIAPERMNQLRNEIVKNWENWEMDYSRESLNVVQEWFEQNIAERSKTDEEKRGDSDQIKGTKFEGIIDANTKVIDEKTVSVCFDVGFYFAECLRKKKPDLKWKPCLSPKSNVNYGHPILATDTSRMGLNARSIMQVNAQKKLKENVNEKQHHSFMKLFDIWDKLF